MDLEIIKTNLEEKEGFFQHNNYHILELSEEKIELRVDLNENSMNPYGIAHGGLIFGLGDTVMGMLASKNGKNVVTLNANISYLSKGKGKYLVATGELIKEGKTTAVARAYIYNDEKKLIATMDGTYYYIEERR